MRITKKKIELVFPGGGSLHHHDAHYPDACNLLAPAVPVFAVANISLAQSHVLMPFVVFDPPSLMGIRKFTIGRLYCKP